MSNEKALFRTLNDGTEAGSALRAKAVGDTPGSDLGSMGFAFRDSSGALVLPQLNAAGQLPVAIATASAVPKKARGANDAGSTSFVTLATIVGALTKKYNRWDIHVACQNEAEFEIVHIDDVGGTPTETIIGTLMTGPGNYSARFSSETSTEVDTTGGTGTQNIIVRGKNLHKASRLTASISVVEN